MTLRRASLRVRAPRGPRRGPSRAAGFSFIEILVVMGIIAVLAGIGVGVYVIAFKKTPEIKSKALIQKIRGELDLFYAQFHAFPPTDLNKLALVTGMPFKVGKVANTTNMGIEAVYQCLMLPGFDHKPELGESELSNTDDDRLDKPLSAGSSPELFEVRDGWGNPLVYFVDGDYAQADKEPATYIVGSSADADAKGGGDAVQVKPWRLSTGGFAQPGRYQLFSMGPDGLPNTDDDIKAWGE